VTGGVVNLCNSPHLLSLLDCHGIAVWLITPQNTISHTNNNQPFLEPVWYGTKTCSVQKILLDVGMVQVCTGKTIEGRNSIINNYRYTQLNNQNQAMSTLFYYKNMQKRQKSRFYRPIDGSMSVLLTKTKLSTLSKMAGRYRRNTGKMHNKHPTPMIDPMNKIV